MHAHVRVCARAHTLRDSETERETEIDGGREGNSGWGEGERQRYRERDREPTSVLNRSDFPLLITSSARPQNNYLHKL